MKHFVLVVVALVLSVFGACATAGETYQGDPVHSSVVFRIKHVDISYVYGRFNDPITTFTLDEADPTKSSFSVEIPVANVDTHNEKRDGHLKSPDFFNAKQYPTITFK